MLKRRLTQAWQSFKTHPDILNLSYLRVSILPQNLFKIAQFCIWMQRLNRNMIFLIETQKLRIESRGLTFILSGSIFTVRN